MNNSLMLMEAGTANVTAHATKMYVAFLTIAFLVAPAFFPESLKILLEFNRSKLADGEYWRLWTSHFVHFTIAHLIMNLSSLILIGYLCFWQGKVFPYLCAMILLPAGISLVTYHFYNQPSVFRGFSASSHGLLALGALLLWRHRRYSASILLLLLTVKLIYERMPLYDRNQMIDVFSAPVAVEAHFSGAVIGASLGLIYMLFDYAAGLKFKKYSPQS